MSPVPYQISLGLLSAVAAGLMATGCVTGFSGAPSNVNAGFSCVDDSEVCLTKRRQALTEIMADTEMRWISQPATAGSDASGVRIFAFMKKRKHLSCQQLRIGFQEATGARQRLRQAAGSGLTPAQISRGAILGDEVAGKLRKEMRRKRCKIA